MRRNNLSLYLAVFALVVPFKHVSPQAPAVIPAVMLGTWKLNVAKSYWSGSIRPSKAETTVRSARDGKLHVDNERFAFDGRVLTTHWVGLFDGADYPAGEGQTRAFTLINDYAYDAVTK